MMETFNKVKAAVAGKKKYIAAAVVGVVAAAGALGYNIPQGVIDFINAVVIGL